MALFNDKVRTQISDILKGMAQPVRITLFTQEFECNACMDARTFVEEIAALSNLIKLTIRDFQKDASAAADLGVDKIPAILMADADGRDLGIRYYGLPGGYEINSFLTTLVEASGKREPLSPQASSRLAGIEKDVRIQVFISPTCPYCPAAVIAAHRLAMEHQRIVADMVDAALYPHLIQRYGVSGVPHTVVNETQHLVGAQPVEKLLDAIEKG